jgi:hypothetical protein
MGYQRPTLKLVFDDPEMDGLVDRCRRMSIGRFAEFLGLKGLDLRDEAVRSELAKISMEYVTDWNLEEAGERPDDPPVPVPATPEGFLSQDTPFIQAMTRALEMANRGIPAPLEQPSPNGDRSLEESMPMEVSSPSPES